MNSHLLEMLEQGLDSPMLSLKWREEVTKIIMEHRPQTLPSEIETLLNIALDVYSLGLEDVRDYLQQTYPNADNMATSLQPVARTEVKNKTSTSS